MKVKSIYLKNRRRPVQFPKTGNRLSDFLQEYINNYGLAIHRINFGKHGHFCYFENLSKIIRSIWTKLYTVVWRIIFSICLQNFKEIGY